MRKADERCGAVFRRLVVSKTQRTDYSKQSIEMEFGAGFCLVRKLKMTKCAVIVLQKRFLSVIASEP